MQIYIYLTTIVAAAHVKWLNDKIKLKNVALSIFNNNAINYNDGNTFQQEG